MFEMGWQADRARPAEGARSSSAHARLGLVIVRGIVEAHGGNVRARHVDEGFSLDIIPPSGIPADAPTVGAGRSS
jgi:signal transduction histidine kinase